MLLKSFLAFISTIGFSIMFNLPKKLLAYAGMTGGLGFLTYLYVINIENDYIIAALLGSFVVGIFGQLFAIFLKHPSTLFTIPGIIPLVPGYDLYNAMFYLVEKNTAEAASYGIKAILISISIACGIAISSTLMIRLKPLLSKMFKAKV